mgnify:FL=1
MDGLMFVLLLFGLLIIAALYASVGHGGASGYLALLSMTTLASMEDVWLKQHAWCLNLVVAGIAFWHYHREGYHVPRLTIPFIAASIPLALLGGYLSIGGDVYDLLLSLTLLWAAWRLWGISTPESSDELEILDVKTAAPLGGLIGLVSGVVGVGGGIFLTPILLLKRLATPKQAAATSALFIWVNSLAGLTGSIASGRMLLELEMLAPFICAVLLGGFVGSRYGALAAPQVVVRRLLVGVLLIAASKRILEMSGVWI